MPTEMLTKPEPMVSQPPPVAEPAEDKLHERARKRVERRHSVKANVAAFVAGMVVLMPVWLLVEWQSKGGFKRWSDAGNRGDWDAWFLYIAIPWLLWVVFVCVRAYVDRDNEAEIERELAKLTQR